MKSTILPQKGAGLRYTFSPSVLVVALLIVILFAAFTEYHVPGSHSAHVQQYYGWLLDVELMIFVGFGFLMTFLRKYGYGAVGLNFFASALVMLEAIVVVGAVQQIMGGHRTGRIGVDLPLLIDSSFCAGAAMIAFGAVIGKTTPTELLWLLFFMVPIYALNQHLVFKTLRALDMGGSITIHVFGAYYGLAASMMISAPRQTNYGTNNPKNSASYISNIFSMIGTIFLWIFWPSFNGALASLSAEMIHEGEEPSAWQAAQQYHCVTNTLLSLLGSCIATFAVSAAINGKLDMMHVQNATLAGGVAMGSSAALAVTPGGALAVGLGAGAISTCGFAFLLPFLERTIHLGDTCGVHNLHGIPGIIGGLVAGFVALGQEAAALPRGDGPEQLGIQFAAVAVTVAIGAAGGLLSGALVSSMNPAGYSLDGVELFDDGAFWKDEDVEMAYACPGVNNSCHSQVVGVPSVHGGTMYTEFKREQQLQQQRQQQAVGHVQDQIVEDQNV